jgi:hypothetical protein
MGLAGTFDAARRRVHAHAGAQRVLPSQPHRLERCTLGLAADECRITGAVRLAEGVAAGHQGDGLLVVHRHVRKGLASVAT